MPYTVSERSQGRRPSDGDRPANEVPYLVVGDLPEVDDVEEDAKAALGGQAAATLDGLKLLDWKIDERLSAGFFLGTATYGTGNDSGQKETGESTFAFDTTGGTFNVKQSLATVSRLGPGGVTAPDMKGGINVTGDDVEGVDITIPQYAWSETHYLDAALVTDTYKGLLFALTGTKNNANFKGLHAGENLFLGARGTQRARGDWEITFLFAGSPNVTGLAVGDITGIAKKGWDYLWVRTLKNSIPDSSGKKVLAVVPQYVYVEKVYEDANHALLGIGS